MKKALITGASTGIGETFVKELTRRGWDVYGIARSADKLAAILPKDHYLAADLTNPADLKRAVDFIESTRPQLLINNAGTGYYTGFIQGDLQQQLAMMKLNMDALVVLSHAYLRQAKSGDALMNISSALSLLPMPGSAVYSATKSFVTAFTECLWYEFKDKGIYVMADLPGPVRTPFHEVSGSSSQEMDKSGLVLSPEAVVNEALRTLEKRQKPSVVNGVAFKFFTRVTQLVSRKMRLKIMAGNSPAKW